MLSLKTSTVNSSSRTGYTSILVSILKSIAWNSLGKNLISLTEGLPPKAAGCPTTPEVPTRREALLTAPAAKSLQSCRTLCDPIEGSPPGSPVPGILQARTLEWGAMSFSNASKWKVKVKSLSPVRFFETPWTVAYQAPPSMDFPGTSTGVGCQVLRQHVGAAVALRQALLPDQAQRVPLCSHGTSLWMPVSCKRDAVAQRDRSHPQAKPNMSRCRSWAISAVSLLDGISAWFKGK